jgi:hypothetical protein
MTRTLRNTRDGTGSSRGIGAAIGVDSPNRRVSVLQPRLFPLERP